MKQIFIIIAALSLMLLTFAGCGHLDGNDPEGVLGGHIGGYGSFGGSFGGEYWPDLLGSWNHGETDGSFETVTFNADAIVKVEYFNSNSQRQRTVVGTFFITADRLDLNVEGWNTGSSQISIDNNVLTLTRDNQSTSYIRIN